MKNDYDDTTKKIKHASIVIMVIGLLMIAIGVIAVKVENEKQHERERRETLKQINILGREYNMIRTNLNRYVYVDKEGNEIEIERNMAEKYKKLEK